MIPTEAADFVEKLAAWLTNDSKGRPKGTLTRVYAMAYVFVPHAEMISNRSIREIGTRLGIEPRSFREHVLSCEKEFGVFSRRMRTVSRRQKRQWEDEAEGKEVSRYETDIEDGSDD